jgi:hypothetical protein
MGALEGPMGGVRSCSRKSCPPFFAFAASELIAAYSVHTQYGTARV